MTTKKDLLVAVLLTFCLTVTLFRILATSSSSNGGYDPWVDLNDDGNIDLYDAVILSAHAGTTGTPINKTALLYNINDTFAELLDRIEMLNASLTELQNRSNGTKIRTIRFVDPTEHVLINHTTGYEEIANFTWIPNNKTNNVILSAAFYFEYKRERPDTAIAGQFRTYIGDTRVYHEAFWIHNQGYYIWKPITGCSQENPTKYSTYQILTTPNQMNYTISFKIGGFGPTGDHIVYFRNINLILQVADGMQVSNP